MSSVRMFFISRSAIVADICALIAAWAFSTQVAGHYQTGFSLQALLQMRFSVSNAIGAFFLGLIWIQVLRAQGLYKPQPASRKYIELRGIAVAGGVTTILHASIGHFFGIKLFSPLFFLCFWLSIFVFDFLFRKGWSAFLGALHLGDNNRRNIIIVGTNESAWVYANRLREDHHKAYNLLGFIDDIVVIAESQQEHLGVLNDFEELLNHYVVDEVVVAMPIRSCSESIQKIIDHAHERGIAVRFPMLQIFSGIARNDIWRVRQEVTLGANGEFTHDLVVFSGHVLGWHYFTKRSMDMLFAFVILILASPLMLFAFIGTLVTSGLPVIFIQDRYGYNGRVFRLYKFRTMTKNADNLQEQLRDKNQRDGAAFKLDNDPRVTKFGKLLRKTSIDELPQLFNVIKGEMSIVGPRPLPLADYKRMNTTSHRRRLSVLPGITGPWQISGRDNISFEQWMQMDLDYIDNWRVLTDLKIILMTIPTVLFARGSK